MIKPRQHILFWADGMPNRGTFHVSFTLDPSKENYIALYDSNGKTLIDEITVPAGMLADQSYAREEDGSANWVIKGGGEHSYVTPSTNNMTLDKNEKIENNEFFIFKLLSYFCFYHKVDNKIFLQYLSWQLIHLLLSLCDVFLIHAQSILYFYH